MKEFRQDQTSSGCGPLLPAAADAGRLSLAAAGWLAACRCRPGPLLGAAPQRPTCACYGCMNAEQQLAKNTPLMAAVLAGAFAQLAKIATHWRAHREVRQSLPATGPAFLHAAAARNWPHINPPDFCH